MKMMMKDCFLFATSTKLQNNTNVIIQKNSHNTLELELIEQKWTSSRPC